VISSSTSKARTKRVIAGSPFALLERARPSIAYSARARCDNVVRKMRRNLPWLAGLAAAVLSSCAERPFRGDTGIRPFAFDVYDVHCPSGLRVIFERAPRARTAGVTSVVGVGSRQDPEGREGLAHLVEHLTFRAHAPDADPLRIRLWAMGAAYNAGTGFDETSYYAYAPAQSLAALLAAEGERLLDPLAGVDEATFAVERDVVRNELRERNETHMFGAAYQAAYKAVFPDGHPYARPVGGSHGSLSALSLDDARCFVERWYRPRDMTLVVIGDMDLSAIEAFVKRALPPALYGDVAHPVPIGKPPVVTATAPGVPGAAGLARARETVSTPELWIAWSLPGGFGTDYRIAQMWASLATQNFFSGRLADTDVAGVALFAQPGELASIFICRVTLTEGQHPEESLRQVLAAVPWIADDDVFMERRFESLKLAQLRELAFGAESVIHRARDRADYAHFNGSLSAYGGMVGAVKAITPDRARDFTRRYLGRERARAVLVEPIAGDARPPTPLPAAADLATIVAHTPLPAATLEALARVRHLDGLRTTRLGNGLDLVVLRRPGAPVLTASLAFHGGWAAARPGVAEAVREALDLSVEESPGAFGIGLALSLQADLFSMSVRAGAGNLPRALDMLAFATRSLDLDWPSDKFRETKLPFLRHRDAAPAARSNRSFYARLYRGHPFGTFPTAEEIAAPAKAELRQWIDRTIAPANAALIIVGDADPAEVEAAARDSFGGWHESVGPVPPPTPALAPPTGAPSSAFDGGNALVTHRPGGTQAEIDLGCLLPATDPRVAATYDVAAQLLESYLHEELRERTGSTYGAHVWITTLRGGTADLRVSADVDNGRLPLALATLRGFWQHVTSGDIDARMIGLARDTLTSGRLLGYESSGALAHALVESWNLGWPLTSIDAQPPRLAAVGKADVDAAFSACARNLVVAITGDQTVIRAALAPAPVVISP
jgi:zinc protease